MTILLYVYFHSQICYSKTIMSYRISTSIFGSLTLTSCTLATSEQWQGQELQQSICLDEPVPYEYYSSYYYDYYCQNTDITYTSLPWTFSLYEEVITQQYFLDISRGIGTFIIQQNLVLNDKQYISSYFIRTKTSHQSGKIVMDFGYQSLECQSQENFLKCSWYNDIHITFEPASTEIMIFND
jgi:hypothetical protein